jgi:hypothetical protein
VNLTRPIAFLDIESTGLDPVFDRIIDLAVVKFAGSFEPLARHSFRVNPGIPIPAAATAIHGISNADVADCQTFNAVAPMILAALEGCDLGGFQLSYGDTGVRSLTLTPNAPCSTLAVEIRRLGNICHIDVSWLNGVITTPQAEFNLSDTALPSGFGNTKIQRGVAWTNYLASAGGAIHIASGNILKANVVSAGMSAAGGSTMQRSWAYTTLDAWPTVLPGTAVGSIPNA